MKKLTTKQIANFTLGKKHWSEKKKHIIGLAKDLGIIIKTENELHHLMETHIPSEIERIKREFYTKSMSGEIKSNITPTDVKGDFIKVEYPVIGKKYHISWAYSGAYFILREVVGDMCYLDNPKYSRLKQGKKLIACHKSELRGMRSKRYDREA